MGGFMGIGKSSAEREMERQEQLKKEEAERSRRDAEVRLAEKKALKGQEVANIKLGTAVKDDSEEELLKKGSGSSISSSLAIGGAPKKKTGVQV